MTSSKLIGIAFAILVAFSVACAAYIYIQQGALQNAQVSSRLYEAEKQKLLSRLETDKSFRERLVDESLQHRKVIDALEVRLANNQRALKAARASLPVAQPGEPQEDCSPELKPLRERVTLLESSNAEHDKESSLLTLALSKSTQETDVAKSLFALEQTKSESLAHDLKRERRRKIFFAIGGVAVGAGLGAVTVAIAK